MLKIRYSETATKDADIKKFLKQPMAFAEATARHIHRRVAMEGRTATPSQPYAPKGGFVTSPEYAARAGATGTRFASSAAFHASAGKPAGRFNTTGGMWAGLQVRNYGSDGAIIEFSGISLGAKSQKTNRKGKRVRGPVSVPNRAKAWSVFRSSNVGVLENTDDELTAYAEAMAELSSRYLHAVFGAPGGVEAPRGNRSLVNAILLLAR